MVKLSHDRAPRQTLRDITNSQISKAADKALVRDDPMVGMEHEIGGTTANLVNVPVVYQNPTFQAEARNVKANQPKISPLKRGQNLKAEEKKISLVAWDKICLPKENGGLGLRMARQLNRAYITKLAFFLFKDKDRLWVRVLQHKYFKESARAGLRLIDFADPLAEGFDIDSSVADFVNSDGSWNFELLERLLPPYAVDLVAGMSPPKEDKGNDDWVWGCESSGLFSIKSAYALICKVGESVESEKWRTIWNSNGPNRVKFFLWLATKDRLLTNAARMRRNLCQAARCPRCAANIEDSCHVWRGPYVDWMLFFLNSEISLLFGIVCHNFWKARNEFIFVNKVVEPLSVALRSCRWRETMEEAMLRDTLFREGQSFEELLKVFDELEMLEFGSWKFRLIPRRWLQSYARQARKSHIAMALRYWSFRSGWGGTGKLNSNMCTGK
ncbi:Putative ribonuclease H protein At1g65750 [Linum perenne]